MTHTTEIEYHRERGLVHFGSPQGTAYWKPNPDDDTKTVRYVTRFRKKGIR